MAVHWTYRDVESPDDDLEQGDILSPSSELRELFQKFHPHFNQDKYLGFLVASQSCDLMRRKSLPKTGYITLAAIRPLSKMMPKLISQIVPPVAPGKFPKHGAVEAKRLLERIFNQNEQGIGIFFLYPDADLHLGEEAVALLRVTVSVKSEHYEILTKTRVGRLKPVFQAKLGWLLGNLYNRPATPDWDDNPGSKEKYNQLMADFFQPKEAGPGFTEITWIEDVLISEANRLDISLETATLADLERLRPPPVLERALDEIQSQIEKIIPSIGPQDLRKIQNRLRNSGKFAKLFR